MLKKYNQNKLNKADKNLQIVFSLTVLGFLYLSIFTLWYCYLEQL